MKSLALIPALLGFAAIWTLAGTGVTDGMIQAVVTMLGVTGTVVALGAFKRK